MTERHRSFATKKKSEEDLKPVSFDIDDERFFCHPSAAGSTILEFVGATEEGGGAVAARILPFFNDVMPEDEYARFREYIDDPKRQVDIEVLSDIVGYLAEEYTSGRPTERSE